MKKPVVVFLNHWAEAPGGAEFSLQDIAGALSKTATTHCITSEEGPLVASLRQSGVTCHIFPMSASLINVKRDYLITSLMRNIPALLSFVHYIAAVRRLVVEIRPDCIHANVPKSHFTLFFLRMTGIHSRGVIHFREIFPKRSLAYRLYQLCYLPARTPEVISISHAVKNALPPGMQRRATVIYNGVTILGCTAAPSVALPIRFLYLGRVVPWKGCDFLVSAFFRLIQECGSAAATLSLIGDTRYWSQEYRSALSSRIRTETAPGLLSLQPHRNDIKAVFDTHDVLCLPSLNEPFGRVAAEAQGAGLPVIGWQSGGLPEVVENGVTGILTPVENLQAYTDAMRTFIAHPENVVTMGEQGIQRSRVLFNRELQLPHIAAYLTSHET